MLLPTFLSTTAFALTATAFLIPPEVSNDALKASNLISSAVNPDTQSINLDCSTCPFAIAANEWIFGVDNELVVNFVAEDSHLKLNGVPFYPGSSSMPEPLFAKQVKKDDSQSTKNVEAYDGDRRLSYSLEFKPEVKPINGDKDSPVVVPIAMQILGLDGAVVNIDSIEILALKFPDGHVSLPSLRLSSPANSFYQLKLQMGRLMKLPVSPDAPGAQCTTILCRMFAVLHAKMASARTKVQHACACVMKKLHLTRPPPPHHQHHPAGGPPSPLHDGHRHHRTLAHKIARVAHRIFAHVLLPILVGIGAGMAVSAVGLLVGQVLLFFWMRYTRFGRVNREYTALHGEEVDVEKEALPAYEELEGVAVNAKDEKA
ncbi:hypothetical protein MMC12_001840 [Toensbergia leucococca]|nr:hypothetical protein [Toensbergia leucococca]